MPTPIELRTNARKNIADAWALLEQSPKNAVYLAGYAPEFMLKARYCRKRGWDRFPESVKELREWNDRDGVVLNEKLFVHDLETLMRVSDSVALKASSYNRIDWDRVGNWSESVRYEPVDSIAPAEAEAIIAEIEKLCDEILVLELLEALVKIERELHTRFGLFHCFALVKPKPNEGWRLWVAWYARNENEGRMRETALQELIQSHLDEDLQRALECVEKLNPDQPVLNGLYLLLRSLGGGIAHSPRSMVARNIVSSFPMFPDGFVITAGAWGYGSLEASWLDATDLPAPS